jgi:hypothetical protein
MKKVCCLLALVLCLALPGTAGAGDVSLSGGVAAGTESSVMYSLNAQYAFDPFWENEAMALRFVTRADVAYWVNADDELWAGALGVGLNLAGTGSSLRPYVTAAIGPALISQNHFDKRKMGRAFQFQSRGALGLSFGSGLRHCVEASITHYSNAETEDHNDGYTACGLSYAYRF